MSEQIPSAEFARNPLEGLFNDAHAVLRNQGEYQGDQFVYSFNVPGMAEQVQIHDHNVSELAGAVGYGSYGQPPYTDEALHRRLLESNTSALTVTYKKPGEAGIREYNVTVFRPRDVNLASQGALAFAFRPPEDFDPGQPCLFFMAHGGAEPTEFHFLREAPEDVATIAESINYLAANS